MSGFTNITGFVPPTSLSGFMGLLQTATFRGVPFKVIAGRVKKRLPLGRPRIPLRRRRLAEDMSRAFRTYAFSGYLIGDLAPVMQNLLDIAIETEGPGPGPLIHPTISAQQVGLLSSATSVHRDHLRVIEVAFEFIGAGSSLFPLTIIATVVSVLSAADSALTATGTDFTAVASLAAAGPPVLDK
jgi:DNA circularisation protein N-terminus